LSYRFRHSTSQLCLLKCMTIDAGNSSFEFDAEGVKKQNWSPGALDLIMHVTSELPIGLGSYDLFFLSFFFFLLFFFFFGCYKMSHPMR